MSVNDIMKYVSKTPGNTNPAVIKSMVETENYGVLEKARQMDEETLALAKAYTDSQRLGYVDKSETILYPKTELVFANGVASVKHPNGFNLESTMFIIGHINTIIWDGVEYQCETTEGSNRVYLGNKERHDGTGDNGMPFFIQALTTSGNGQVVALDDKEHAVETSTHTLEIRDIDEAVHQIDPKFIPGGSDGGLPEVTLTTVVGASSTIYGNLTSDEVALLSRPDPVLMRFKLQIAPEFVLDVATVSTAESVPGAAYIHEVAVQQRLTIMFQIQGDSGVWMAADLRDTIEDILYDMGITPTAATAETGAEPTTAD